MRTPKPLKYYKNRHGCFIVTSHYKDHAGYAHFYRDGKIWRIHRWIYQKYYGEIPKGMLVCHSCDNPSCINLKHLFLGTQKDNIQDALKKGRMQKGENHTNSKLTENQIREIRKSYESNRVLGRKYNVNHSIIGLIKRNRLWKHVA